MPKKSRAKSPDPKEIPVVGEVEDWEKDVLEALLEVPTGGECVFYIDSEGGSVYGALAVLAMVRHRELRATAVVLGECSSATLLVFAACEKRLVTRLSAFLFHRMRWQSERRVNPTEAVSWAKHFQQIEREMDELLIRLLAPAGDKIREWTNSDRYITGTEMIDAGLAEAVEVG